MSERAFCWMAMITLYPWVGWGLLPGAFGDSQISSELYRLMLKPEDVPEYTMSSHFSGSKSRGVEAVSQTFRQFHDGRERRLRIRYFYCDTVEIAIEYAAAETIHATAMRSPGTILEEPLGTDACWGRWRPAGPVQEGEPTYPLLGGEPTYNLMLLERQAGRRDTLGGIERQGSPFRVSDALCRERGPEGDSQPGGKDVHRERSSPEGLGGRARLFKVARPAFGEASQSTFLPRSGLCLSRGPGSRGRSGHLGGFTQAQARREVHRSLSAVLWTEGHRREERWGEDGVPPRGENGLGER